jgi:hypothetical protein
VSAEWSGTRKQEDEAQRRTFVQPGLAGLMDGSLVNAFWLLRSVCPIRNSFGDSCDVTVKTGTDLAKTRKSQVTFAALNSNKKPSV